MTIRKRGTGFQVDVSFEGRRLRRTATTVREAKELEGRLLIELANGTTAIVAPKGNSEKSMTLRELADYTHRMVWKNHKLSSQRTSEINARSIVDILGGDTPIQNITTDAIDGLITTLQGKGLTRATVNRKLAALSSMLTLAVQRKFIPAKPYIAFNKESQGRVRFLTPTEEAEVHRLLDSWGMHSISQALTFGIHTGFRMSEILELESDDCVDGVITLWYNKTDKGHTIPMNSVVREIVKDRIEQGFTGRLFADVAPHHIDKAIRMLREVMKPRNPDEFCWHTITRHTCASRMVQKGVPILEVSKYLNHSSLKTTMRYAHLAPANLQSAADALAA